MRHDNLRIRSNPPGAMNTSRWSRRDILQGLAISLGAGTTVSLLGGCVPDLDSAGGQPGLRTALAWIRNVEYAGLWVALESGFYDEEDVVPQFLSGGPNAPMPTVAVTRNSPRGASRLLRRSSSTEFNSSKILTVVW